MSKDSSNKSVEKIIIFGYAAVGKKLYERLKHENAEDNIVFCDNSSTKQGVHNGIKVIPLQEAVAKYGEAKFVVASLRHSKQMEQQLLDAGIPKKQIITELPGDIVGEELAKEQNQRLVPLDSIHIEVNINKNCNLKCKGCDHFAPIAEAGTLELDVFERDMKRLADVMAGHIHRIILLGGEPLLNENLLEYVKIAREYMSRTEIFIATNGTLLGKMGEEFWCVLRSAAVGLMVTKYPVKLDYDGLKKLAEGNGIVWEYIGSSESGRTLWHFPLDLSGSQDAMDSFIHCANANACHTLERGRLYTCSIAPNIQAFNNFYGKNVPLTVDDGIDIHMAHNAKEILEFLAKPINFCRYCNVKGRTYDHSWEISKQDIKEWT